MKEILQEHGDTALHDEALQVLGSAHMSQVPVAASQSMIDEGHHREAMLWMVGAIHLANTAIQNDAPAAEKVTFQARYDSLLQALGLRKVEDWQHRQQRLQNLTTQCFNLADRLVTSNPMIRD